MLIYIERQKKIINTDQIAWIQAVGRKPTRVEVRTGANVRNDIYIGTGEEADELIEMIATAMDRGQEMLWIKPSYLTQASDEYV